MVGGAAGDGTFLSGNILARTLNREGFYVFATNEYLSVIRGGYQWYLVRASNDEVYSQLSSIDLLIALNDDAVIRHYKRLKKEGLILVDEKDIERTNLKISENLLVKIPLSRFVKEVKGLRVMRNLAALGAAVALLNLKLDILLSVIRDVFSERRHVVEVNVTLAKKGYEYIKKKEQRSLLKNLDVHGKSKERVFVTGNEAVGLGALKAGLGLYVAYPITPASPLLHFLAKLQREYNIIVLQPESEIAAINIAIGAAYAGVKSMVGTSGAGFSLMTEALGLAAMSETPLVIMLAQRPGPSTGMPTFTSQGDLRFVLHASQGEFPRVVIAPGDVEEAFYLTIKSFNIAWKYQVPVIILMDKYLAESGKTVFLDESKVVVENGKIIRDFYNRNAPYRRYELVEDGISPMAIPGTKGAIVKANSTEHDEWGFVTTDPDKVVRMVDKRFKKLSLLEGEMYTSKPVKTYGRASEVVMLTWGSVKGPALEALRILRDEGITIGLVHVMWLSPFPANILRGILRGKRIILLENNKTGLFNSLLREHLFIDAHYKILKYDGRPFYPEEIVEEVKKVV